MREVNHHRTTGFYGQGDQVKIEAGPLAAGGAPIEYHVSAPEYSLDIDFMTREAPAGLTNEALLAIVLDRLDCFQEGPCACMENAVAAAYIRRALQQLQCRTERRVGQGLEGQLVEDVLGKEIKVAEKQRVWIDGNRLRIDAGQRSADIDVDSLRGSWGSWNKVESALRYLDPPIMPEEMQVLNDIATTPQAKNGLAEVKSALATSTPRKPA